MSGEFGRKPQSGLIWTKGKERSTFGVAEVGTGGTSPRMGDLDRLSAPKDEGILNLYYQSVQV